MHDQRFLNASRTYPDVRRRWVSASSPQGATRRGFTLFEIAIALALVAVGITSVLVLFPTGIRTQQLARYQLLATAKAQEMVECFAAGSNLNPAIDTEAEAAWDVPVGYRALSNDLEIRIATHNYGIAPVPPRIAARLDSDDDEIARVLDEGGELYYSQPMATTSFFQSSLGAFQPTEAQRLVFAPALALAFLARMRTDGEEMQRVLRVGQARIMLIAACTYVQEASRIGWDDPTTPEHEECFGWLDVRDGTPGPKPVADFAAGARGASRCT